MDGEFTVKTLRMVFGAGAFWGLGVGLDSWDSWDGWDGWDGGWEGAREPRESSGPREAMGEAREKQQVLRTAGVWGKAACFRGESG